MDYKDYYRGDYIRTSIGIIPPFPTKHQGVILERGVSSSPLMGPDRVFSLTRQKEHGK